MYSELELAHVQETLRVLQRRIEERFPDSSLGQVAGELCQIADATGPVIEKLRRPNWLVRAIVAFGVLVLLGLASNLSNKIWQKIVILDTMPGLE